MRARSGLKNVSSLAVSLDAAPTGQAANRLSAIAIWVAVALYVAIEIVLALRHEPWVDEAQAWLQATSLARPLDFLIIPGEGHPPLWYWLLRILSLGLDFNQARFVPLLVAIANAFLLARLLRHDLLVLVTMLFSFLLLQFWGYHFRPYCIVFSCIVGALLLDRANRSVAATWVLALACGFHFFAGFVFAFWLVWQWQRGTKIRNLIAPSLLALAFGLSAILSGLGNQTAGVLELGLFEGTMRNLAWLGMVDILRNPITALLTLAALVFALRRTPVLLAALLVLVLLFSIGSAAVYGKYPWHTAFLTMLCFVAFTVTGFGGRKELILALMLTPQVIFGLASISARLTYPYLDQPDLYTVVSSDAGKGFMPETDLVVWPDLAGLALTASNNVTAIDGTTGGPTGPIQWRTRQPARIDPLLAAKPGPYWLVCAPCTPVVDALQDQGRTATLLAAKPNFDNGDFFAYRID